MDEYKFKRPVVLLSAQLANHPTAVPQGSGEGDPVRLQRLLTTFDSSRKNLGPLNYYAFNDSWKKLLLAGGFQRSKGQVYSLRKSGSQFYAAYDRTIAIKQGAWKSSKMLNTTYAPATSDQMIQATREVGQVVIDAGKFESLIGYLNSKPVNKHSHIDLWKVFPKFRICQTLQRATVVWKAMSDKTRIAFKKYRWTQLAEYRAVLVPDTDGMKKALEAIKSM